MDNILDSAYIFFFLICEKFLFPYFAGVNLYLASKVFLKIWLLPCVGNGSTLIYNHCIESLIENCDSITDTGHANTADVACNTEPEVKQIFRRVIEYDFEDEDPD